MSSSEWLQPPPPNCAKDRKVFFFDVDNTLYQKATGIGELMQDYIRRYIENTLHLDASQAENLHQTYYKHYGLAIEGLVRQNHVNAMDYNTKVDDALPLEDYLQPDKQLRNMLARIDRTKWKLWLCTNAYRNHGLRVVKLLGIEEFFEGITYCDYERIPMVCKPMPEFFLSAMNDVGISYNENTHTVEPACYFVDDSEQNVRAAESFGWHAIQISEPKNANLDFPSDMMNAHLLPPLHEGAPKRIQYILQLPAVCPELFE